MIGLLPERSRKALPAAFVLAAAFIFAFRFMSFIWKYSVNLLYYDQWDFLNSFFGRDPGVGELFYWQHGPHREGVGLIADELLYPLTSWNVRAECLMIGVCIVAAMLLALLLKKRLFGKLDYWDALIPMIFLTLAQYEGLTIRPNPAYSAFPLLLLMLYLLALLLTNDILKYGLVLVINYLLIFTGFGVFMGIVTIGLFGLLCYRRMRGFTVVPVVIPVAGLLSACISLASFFLRYTFQPAVDCFEFPSHRPENYVVFVALMFANVTGIRNLALLAIGLGSILLVFAMFVLMVQMKRMGRAAPLRQSGITMAILLSYSVLFAANTAIGRVCLGLPAAAQASRYCTLMIPAFLALYFFLRAYPPTGIRTLALLALMGVLIPGHVRGRKEAEYYASQKRAWAACYLQTEDIGTCDTLTKFRIYPDPARTRLKEKLDYLKMIGANLFAN